MAQELAISEPKPSELLLSIMNARPLPASLVSDLLYALSKDYRRQNRGRTLVISRLNSGSLWIYLSDMAQLAAPYATNAVDAAKGGKAIFDFGKGIRDAISWKKTTSTSDLPSSGPYRSVETLVKVAAESGSHIRVRQIGSDGSSIDVELSPGEAVWMKEQSEKAKQALVAPEVPALLSPPRAREDLVATRLADRLQHVAVTGSGDPDGVIEAIVEALLSAGSVHVVEQVAFQLESRGYLDLAARIRNFGRGGPTTQLVTY